MGDFNLTKLLENVPPTIKALNAFATGEDLYCNIYSTQSYTGFVDQVREFVEELVQVLETHGIQTVPHITSLLPQLADWIGTSNPNSIIFLKITLETLKGDRDILRLASYQFSVISRWEEQDGKFSYSMEDSEIVTSGNFPLTNIQHFPSCFQDVFKVAFKTIQHNMGESGEEEDEDDEDEDDDEG